MIVKCVWATSKKYYLLIDNAYDLTTSSNYGDEMKG